MHSKLTFFFSSISTAPIFQLTLVRKPNPFLRLIALLQLQVLPWPWSGSGHLYWFFHYDDALESPFCGFDFIVCTNVGSNRWNLNFQILMKLLSKIRCEVNYNYNYNWSFTSGILGRIPTEIGLLTNLQGSTYTTGFNLSNNKLTGSL